MYQMFCPAFVKVYFSIFISALLFTASTLASPGDLDLTFNGTGFSRIGFGSGHDEGHAAAVQSDGKLVMAGTSTLNYPSGPSEFALVRFDTNNVLDASFGNGGKVLTLIRSNAYINALKIQADGKIVAAGYSYDDDYFASDFTLARYKTDGSLDTSFGTNGTGIVFTDFGEGTVIRAIAIQADGKIVAVGHTRYQANAGEGAVALARYETDGTLDVSFGTGGKQITTGVTGYTGAHAVTMQGDGKILAVGIGIGAGHHGVDFALYRYTTNGVLDSAFGGGSGEVFTAITTNASFFSYFDSANAVAIHPGGVTVGNPDKIVVAGSYQNEANDRNVFAIARYNLDGSLDTSFGNGGVVTNGITVTTGNFDGDVAYSLVVQASGLQTRKYVVAGTTRANGRPFFTIARYTATGAFDTTFAPGGLGKAAIPLGTGVDDAQAFSMAIQSGKFVLAGYTGGSSHNYDFAAARFNADGMLDNSFGSGGIATVDILDLHSQAAAVGIQADGKIVVAGNAETGTNNVFALARYNPDGSLDSSFDADGKVLTTFGADTSSANAIAIQPDQKILAAGAANGDFALARYNANGSLDASFGTSGKVTTSIGAGRDNAHALALQKDGKIVVAGESFNGADDDFAVARYTTNGLLDTSFGTSGKTTTAISTGEDVATAAAIQADGKIVLAGYGTLGSAVQFALTRYTSNGVLDSSFGSFGRVVTDFGQGSLSEALAMVIQPDRKIVVGGIVLVGGSTAYFGVARFTTTGALDSSFGTGGKVTAQVGLVQDYATSLVLRPDGRILAGGVSQIGAYGQFALVQFKTDGSLDMSYGTGGKVVLDFNSGTDESGYAVALDSTGRALIAGDAGGEFGVARLLGDPALSIALTPTKAVRVSWPSGYDGWNLQQKADLTNPTWGAPSEAINDDGTNSFIIVNSPVADRFYRLSAP